MFALLFAIVSIAAVLSAVSYGYFLSVSGQIDETVRDDLRRQTRTEAFHLGELLENEIGVVATNTMIVADAQTIRNGNVEAGDTIINARQRSTDHITDRYFWLDAEGKTVWSSTFVNTTEMELYQGFDVSDRPYFVNPASMLEPYFSPVVQSPIDKSQRMFISYPVFGEGRIFSGVVVASIRSDIFGALVSSQLSPEIESDIEIVDPNGIVIYTSDASIIGENIFGDHVQAYISSTLSQQEFSDFNDFLRRSLEGEGESQDFVISGVTNTVTSHPIIINPDEDAVSQHFLTLYLSAPHNVAGIVGPLIEQQRNFSIAVIATIGAVTAVISYIILSWNKRLEQTVRERTASLEKANEQLQIHGKMQKEFINIAAHELRTPIQAILGYSEVLVNSKMPTSQKDLEAIARNAKRLQRLTEDILDVTRIESGKLELKKEKFSIDDVIAPVVQDAKNQLGNEKIRLEYEPRGIVLHADKDRISQIVSNLVINAVKFTEEGTITVTTSVEEASKTMLLSVQDTGTGIHPDMIPRLFSKFATKSLKGTGLGLFIAKSIAEAHGGTIVASNNEGKGATFTLRLPLQGEMI